jgi:ADP-dependent NAD(P)H-hydrate dehydratase / NAD(P)H-hydrate epimerase
VRIGTAKTIEAVDRACVETLGIPLIVLMENAALKVLKHMETEANKKYLIVCGTGNNGGDGLALARHLIVLNKKVEVFIVKSGANMSSCCESNYNILVKMGAKPRTISSPEDIQKLREESAKTEIIVDALFGTGLNREVKGLYRDVINAINESESKIISIDIPSGLQSDTGNVLGASVKAHRTVCFEFYKRGFLNYKSSPYTGEIVVESIGVPHQIIEAHHNQEFLVEKTDVLKHIKKRDKLGHKGTYGRVLIAAGSPGFSGAAYLAAEACVRSGSGLVTLATHEDIQSVLSCKLAEAMTMSYSSEEAFLGILKNCSAAAIGPGMGNNVATLKIVRKLIEGAECPLIIDADGINVLSRNLEILSARKNDIILTPHPGEMSRLTGMSIEYITENRVDVAKGFAAEHGVIVLLKGYETVITDGTSVYINPTGSSAMASGGMGDSLTGIIASLAAQGLKPIAAAFCGAYIHGYSGDMLSEEMYSVNAGKLIENIPIVMKEIVG